MTPQNEDECEAGMENHAKKSRGCIATSYLPLSDIIKLPDIHGIFWDSKETEL